MTGSLVDNVPRKARRAPFDRRAHTEPHDHFRNNPVMAAANMGTKTQPATV
jgi:hypothetical protein